MRFSAVILAGGQSRRMGRDKAWLEVEGQPLIARQIALARAAGAVEVLVSGRSDTDYSMLGCPVILDAFQDTGPLAGIERALETSRSPLLLVLAVDLPRLNLPVLQALLVRCTPQSGAVVRLDGKPEPLCGFYPRASHSLAALKLARKEYAVRDFANECARAGLLQFLDFPAGLAGTFANWNHPQDLR